MTLFTFFDILLYSRVVGAIDPCAVSAKVYAIAVPPTWWKYEATKAFVMSSHINVITGDTGAMEQLESRSSFRRHCQKGHICAEFGIILWRRGS